MLEALPRKVLDLAPQMVAAAADAKGIAPTSYWTAEEWSVGAWVFIQAVNTQLLVLKRILAGREPIDDNAVHTRPDGQVVVDVFPLTGYDPLPLAKAGLLCHRQDSRDDNTAARHISRLPQPDRDTRNPCLRTARVSPIATNE
jgi:hypothetical protein